MNMNELLLQVLADSAGSCDLRCVIARNKQEDYTPSQSAALVAVGLISSARVIHKIDPTYTEYSAQYLVQIAGKEDLMDQLSLFTFENLAQYVKDHILNRKEEDSQTDMDQQCCELTVKDYLQCAFKKGIPRREQWGHLGCVFPVPPYAPHIPRVPMKGEVYETANVTEALKMVMQHPVGARLHVFRPELDNIGEGMYVGPSGDGTTSCYVGLRDVIIVALDHQKGKTKVKVQIFYKKEIKIVNVSLDRPVFLPLNDDGDESQVREPTCLLVDFCAPLFSTN